MPIVASRARWRGLALGAVVLLAGIGLGYFASRVGPAETGSVVPPAYRQLTFRRGWVRAARFAPDGQSIVYSANWDSEPSRVYPGRLERPRAAAAPLADALLLAVPGSGNMAIAIRPQLLGTFLVRGTLAEVPLGGGAPRELLEDVHDADFAPDGRLAIVRSDRGRTRLEFPIGTVLSETAGWLSSPRFSPGGDRIAFQEHPLHDDDRGSAAVVEVATGVTRSLTPEQSTLSGLAWAPGGDEVCFASASTIRCATSANREPRLVLRGAARLILQDIASDGWMLATAYGIRGALVAGEAGGREVDLSWQDAALPIQFSTDGTQLLFGSVDYGVHLRGLDGGPAVRLADGVPMGLAPDGRSVLVLLPEVPTTLAVVPTGPGETRTLARGTLESHTWAAWMPDGRSVVMSATESGRGSRLYIQRLDGGDPRPFTDEGMRLMTYGPRPVSPDGRFVMAIGPDQQPALYAVAGGAPEPMAALGDDLVPIGWSDAPQVIFARHKVLARTCQVLKVDLATGRRELWKEIGPSDPAGAPLVQLVQVSPDGRRYAYTVSHAMSDLFLISGAFSRTGGPSGP